jgi:hypothetical protein
MNATARDEAVRRLREESGRRLEREARRGVVSRCGLGAVLALLSFVSLEVQRSHLRQAAPIAVHARAGVTTPPPPKPPSAWDEKSSRRVHVHCHGIHPKHHGPRRGS